jgi:predicted RNase H-like nuclease (RuvC/YqgF family)
MTRQAKPWARNVNGLRTAAQRKAELTQHKAEAALALLLKEQRPITFNAVAETAGISTAWLYGNEAIKQRIMHLRAQQLPKVPTKIPPREQASASSKDAMIMALRQRIQKLEKENSELKRQVEVSYGLLATQQEAKR